MKYFMVNEEELKDLVSGYYTFSGQPVYKWVNDFLKSKTPVEEIAEGEVIHSEVMDSEALIKTKFFFYSLSSLFDGYAGKKVKIYIEVIK